MARYKNSGRNSGVISYEIDSSSITVQFHDRTSYRYTSASVGIDNLNKMKRLAQSGSGLNSFINKYVKNRYSQKLG